MKKLISSIICLLLVMVLSVTAFATSSASMSVYPSATSVQRGGTLTFTVNLSQVEDCRSGGFVVSYDSSVFEFAGGQCVAAGAALADFSGGTGVFAFGEGQSAAGAVFTFSLRVKDNAPYGTYTVGGSANVRTGEGNIPTGVAGAAVTVSCSHVYGAWGKTDEGSHSRSCSACGHVDTVAHAWNAGSVTRQPSCKAEGETTYTCTACGAVKKEILPKTDSHSYGAPQKADQQNHKQTCTVCGKVNTAEHTWNSGSVTRKATCKAEGQTTYTCTVCSAVKTESIPKLTTHSYQNDCDTNCDICGAARTITHRYSASWSGDAANHWHACTVCGDKTDSAAHTPGPAATESAPQVCTGCGYILAPALGHTHVRNNWLSFDENGHWYACTGCNDNDVYRHAFDNDCDPLCDTCGYQREINHDYGTAWVCDETSHHQTCAVCGEQTAPADHIPGPEATEDAPQICTVCGYELAPQLERLSETQPEEETAVTEASQPESTQPEPEEAQSDESLPWQFVAVIALIVAGGAAAIVIVLTRKRR